MVAVCFPKTSEQSKLHGIKMPKYNYHSSSNSFYNTQTHTLSSGTGLYMMHPHLYCNEFNKVTECLPSPGSYAGCKRCTFCSRFVNTSTVQHKGFFAVTYIIATVSKYQKQYTTGRFLFLKPTYRKES